MKPGDDSSSSSTEDVDTMNLPSADELCWKWDIHDVGFVIAQSNINASRILGYPLSAQNKQLQLKTNCSTYASSQ